MIAIIVSFLIGFIFGFFFLNKKCTGCILLYEDQMYLELTEKDAKKLSNSLYATLNVNRANFKPYIDN